MELSNARVLVISDGRAGHVSQSLGITTALGFPDPEIIQPQGTYPQRWLGWLPLGMLYRNLPDLVAASAQADLLLGTGGGPSRVLRYLKKTDPRLFTVAVMRPKGRLGDYDVVTTPQHDRPGNAPNLITTLGNVNPITAEKLALEGQRWAKRLGHLRGFKLALLVGGPSKHGGLQQPQEIEALVRAVTNALKAQHSNGAALLVTTSARTSGALVAALETALEEAEVPFYLWQPGNPSARDNPYFAYLYHAQAVVVTADSTSMVSEACTSGKPTYVWGSPATLPGKFSRLYASLVKQGRLKWWDGKLDLRPPAAPLLDTMLVAGFIRARWAKRFGNAAQ
jgi:mitochondrial fission protein ELM1